MKPSMLSCDHDQLEAFLSGELTDDEESELADHLNECVGCREQLEASAAEPDCWTQAGDLLKPQDVGHDGSPAERPDELLHVRHVLDALAPTDDPQMLGRLGGYEVSGVVGTGGMGVVLKAFDRSLDRTVAIKVLAPHLASSGAARKRFAREAKAAAAVLHPNVMAIHGVANDEELPYLVMPYLRGVSLQKRIDDEGPLPTCEILRIGSQIAEGLAAAHAQGLVHRDVKPANILLEEGVERVAITDFGLARAVDDAAMTRTGVVAGTPQFMSPEQARGDAVDGRSDLFSLGSVLYTACTGRLPFRADTSFGTLRRITDTEPRAIREINPDVPPWLCEIVEKLMAKQPDDRFASASEVADRLGAWLAHVQQPNVIPPPKRIDPPTASAGGGKRSGGLKYLAGAGFFFSLVLAGILIVLELNKGMLKIECDMDDVPIRIVQGEDVVDRLTVSKSGASVRISAGEYVVEIDGDMDGIAVADGAVSLSRRGEAVVRIVPQDDGSPPDPGGSYDDVERFADLPANTEVHVVGCYTAKDDQPIDVRVMPTGKPMVVVLNAYNATSWNLDVADGADVRGVILAGYFDQRFSHMSPGDVPLIQKTYFPVWKGMTEQQCRRRHAQCFYVWSPLLEDFSKMTTLIKEMTGRAPATYQGTYTGDSFIVNGQHGAADVQLADRWQALQRRADRGSLEYLRAQAELEGLESDTTLDETERIRKMNRRMDRFESHLETAAEPSPFTQQPGRF